MKILALLLVLICQSYSVVAAQDQPKVKEPETLDEFFLLDTVGDIRPLERHTRKAFETQETGSSIQFVQGEPLAFVVRLSDTQPTNPAKLIQFIQLNAQGKNGVTKHANLVPFESTQYGDHSFKIKPKAALAPGEYALGLTTKKDGYYFGVEPVKTDLK